MPKVFRIYVLLAMAMACSPLRQAVAALDLDGDGMSDVWEVAYGARTLNPNIDSDGDGQTNLEEAQAGTHPLEAASVLSIRDFKTLPSATAQVKWPTVAGKQYQVHGSADFQNWTNFGLVTSGDGSEAAIAFSLSSALADGRITVSRWQNMPNLCPLQTVRDYINSNVPPTDLFYPATIETPQTQPNLENYGQWFRGWIVPPATGNYIFWISSDDASELWVSSTASAADKVLVAGTTTFTYFREWTKFASQQSAAIPLVAHQPYYFEVLQKENYGSDHVTVAWTGPGMDLPREIISGEYVSSTGQSLQDSSRKSGVGFRVAVADTDTDGDGIYDADEILVGFDPNDSTTVPRVPDHDAIRQMVAANNVVTVGAPANRAYESNGQPGRFTFFRSGNINPLTIQYTISGTATPFDYAGLTGTTYLGIAQNSVDVQVSPVLDALLEAGETVTVTVVATPEYQAGSPIHATVTIDDAPDQLFVAQLRPDAVTGSNGYGTAALNLAGNNVFANLSVSFSNLTTQQLRSEFYISTTGNGGPAVCVTPAGQVPTQRWNLEPAGGFTKAQILAALQEGRLYARVLSSRFPGGEIYGQFVREQGWQNMPIPPPPPPLSLLSPTSEEAARFLTQATFGPTGADISRFLTLGYENWLQEQRVLPATSHLSYVQFRRAELIARYGNDGWQGPRQEAWWQAALTGQDQLRQRMAFALSEIFVVSDVGILAGSHEGLANYYDLLATRAFGNYRDLLRAVTLSPIMGQYLSMARNQKPNPETGAEPDENYAREMMQLFSIGLSQLHQDGSLKLGPTGYPIPTYTQADIIGLARVFTGWSFYYVPGNPPPPFTWGSPEEMNPMVQYPEYHDTAAKTILNGTAIPAGLTGEQELEIVLDTIFNHPNVGPLLARQLIQRFVTSNPSPGYVYRVAAVFNNNGAGVRGDLFATLKALLLDYEARSSAPLSDIGFGKQRESMLRVSHMLRSLKARPPRTGDSRFFIDLQYVLPQAALKSPSVFNFFQPGYIQPGPIAAAGLFSPEFQITSETTTINQINHQHGTILWGMWTGERDPLNQTLYIHTDQTEEIALLNRPGYTAAQNQQALIDLLSLRLLSGRISAGLRQQITEFFAELPWWYDYSEDPQRQRAKITALLILASPEYAIQK